MGVWTMILKSET